MVVLEAIEPVFLNGIIVEPGSKFSCSFDFSKKLIANNSAKLLEVENTVTKKLLESKTKEDLLIYAKEQGIEGISDSDKKAEIIEAILKAAV